MSVNDLQNAYKHLSDADLREGMLNSGWRMISRVESETVKTVLVWRICAYKTHDVDSFIGYYGVGVIHRTKSGAWGKRVEWVESPHSRFDYNELLFIRDVIASRVVNGFGLPRWCGRATDTELVKGVA